MDSLYSLPIQAEDEADKKTPADPNAIWQSYEIPETAYTEDIYDPRPQPE